MTARTGRDRPASHQPDRAGRTLGRHVVLAAVTVLLVAAFWFTRPEWSPDMRLWRAVGDSAIVLLFASLAVGPAARLSSRAGRILPWRRQVGIWAATAAVVHALLILNGWARWSVPRFLGFEFVPELGRDVRLEPGFGLANLLGLVALGWLLVLLATSSDRAMRFLGPSAWKWLHTGAYVVFYLVVLHAVYYLFIHYTLSFHRAPVPANWFRFPLLALGAAVLALQWAAFAQTVSRRKSRPTVRASSRRQRESKPNDTGADRRHPRGPRRDAPGR